jgi:uncharacterized protein (TIGR04222 family)
LVKKKGTRVQKLQVLALSQAHRQLLGMALSGSQLAAVVIDLVLRGWLRLSVAPSGDFLVSRNQDTAGNLDPLENAFIAALLGSDGTFTPGTRKEPFANQRQLDKIAEEAAAKKRYIRGLRVPMIIIALLLFPAGAGFAYGLFWTGGHLLQIDFAGTSSQSPAMFFVMLFCVALIAAFIAAFVVGLTGTWSSRRGKKALQEAKRQAATHPAFALLVSSEQELARTLHEWFERGERPLGWDVPWDSANQVSGAITGFAEACEQTLRSGPRASHTSYPAPGPMSDGGGSV